MGVVAFIDKDSPPDRVAAILIILCIIIGLIILSIYNL